MSLSDRLQALKSKLTHTKTTVRTPDGKTFEEDFSPDTGHSSVRLTSVPDSFGFVVDTEPDLELSDILRGRVWMGSQDVAADYEKLKEAEISHILNVGTGIPNFFPDQFVYERVEILDTPECRIKLHFQDCFDFIDQALETEHGRVLVHCNAGISRSGAVTVAYVMKSLGLPLREAFALVKEKREKVKPNPGFRAQLKEFERELSLPSS